MRVRTRITARTITHMEHPQMPRRVHYTHKHRNKICSIIQMLCNLWIYKSHKHFHFKTVIIHGARADPVVFLRIIISNILFVPDAGTKLCEEQTHEFLWMLQRCCLTYICSHVCLRLSQFYYLNWQCLALSCVPVEHGKIRCCAVQSYITRYKIRRFRLKFLVCVYTRESAMMSSSSSSSQIALTLLWVLRFIFMNLI